MIRTFEHTVGERVYQITTYPASKGLKILKSLLGIFGPSLTEVFGGIQASDGKELKAENVVVDSAAFSRAAQLFVDNLDREDISKLIEEMCKGILVGGQPIAYEIEFASNYGALVSVLTAIVTENYSSFFGDAGFGGLIKMVGKHQSSSALPKAAS